MSHFGNLERIINTDAGTLMSISGMTTDVANKIATSSELEQQARDFYDHLQKVDIKIITRFDDNYPQRLFELNDPPSLIYYRGEMFDADDKIVCVTGSDNASNVGIELTTSLAKILAEKNIKVISSINQGVDTAGHLGLKSADGISGAVLESGLNQIYPEENRPVAIDILKGGFLISEYPPDTGFKANNYKAANRIIAALSQAVIVTELYENSKRILDLLTCCSQIGKMIFILVNPKCGALIDEKSLERAVVCGGIPLVGLDKIDDIIGSLV